MLIIIYQIILLIHGIENQILEVDWLLDNVASRLMPLGDPKRRLGEGVDHEKILCETFMGKYLSNGMRDIAQKYKGSVLEVVEAVLPQLTNTRGYACELFHSGQLENSTKAFIEIDKHIDESKKVRFGLMKVLDEASKPGSKVTIPMLTCYLKNFSEKFTAVHPEKDGAKKAIKTIMDTFFAKVINALEKKKGKAAESCELPLSTSNPSKYNSILFALLEAIEKIQGN